MNLQQTIQELEQKAQQYREAAEALRALQGNDSAAGGNAASTVFSTSTGKGAASKSGATKKAVSAKAGKTGRKRFVSPETRAKIAAAAKARHAKKAEEAA